MNRFGRITFGIAGGLAILAVAGWAGFQVPPSNLPLSGDAPQDLGTVAVPIDQPTPVHRFYKTAYGERVPRIESLIVRGRARANFGIWTPLRYRLVHSPGYDFERYMEITWFGLPVLKAIDRYLDGIGVTGPVGAVATGPEIDRGANMILWAEAPLMPSLWITDPRIRWEAIDENSARLIFPFGNQDDELTVNFDPQSYLITRITALRYRDADSGKIPWHADFLEWKTHEGVQVPARVSITWEDHGEPWSYWDLEDYYWNVDVSALLVEKSASD